MRGKRLSIALRVTLAIFTVTLFVTSTHAATEKVLYSFNNNGKNGFDPQASLIFDQSGNLYGTTSGGGAYGGGTVFELMPKAGGGWTEKVLHSFGQGKDGHSPLGGVIFDSAGNLYGTTNDGGDLAGCNGFGCGTVFELSPQAGGSWTEKVLHNFGKAKDGALPSSLIFDAGNLYGTTTSGGALPCSQQGGCGTVFELTPKTGGGWTEKILHNFNGKNGSQPLARDS